MESSHNKVLCLALSIFVGATSGFAVWTLGAMFLMGIGDNWPEAFYFFYYVWLVAIPVVPVLTGWLRYRAALRKRRIYA